ncbi:MAG: HEAT repeat domain-containing protein [Bryobacteraceae bacterium]
MTCHDVRDRMPLYLYGELASHQEEEVEAHLHTCSSCQDEYEIQRKIGQLLDNARLEPPALAAVECRRELMATLRRDSREGRPAWWEFLWAGARAALRPAGVVAMLATGFFAGQRFPEYSPFPSPPPAEPMVASVRAVEADASGGVSILLDETRRRRIKGDPNDQRIAQLLMAAARDEANPGLRVESLDILKNHSDSAEVRASLIHSLEQDTNPGVRLKAIEGLKAMAGSPDVRRTLVRVLQRDENPGVRVQAIDLLMQHRDDRIAGVLQGLVGRESNAYVRLRCKNALEEMNASVGRF